MKFTQELKNSKGFTLVELMVVVAIIGILSAVAIPNFKKYQAKTKTSEAKLQLASIYSAMTALQTDYDSFGTCLGDAGYVSPNGTWDGDTPSAGNNYYAIGFPDADTDPNEIVTDNGGVCADTRFGAPAFKKVGGERTVVSDLSNIDTSSATGMGNDMGSPGVSDDGGYFIAGAIGYIDTDFSDDIAKANQWAIDQNKTLREFNRGY